MQRVTVLCAGKMKERFLQEAADEYIKRLSRYVKLEVIEVLDEKTPDNASEAEEKQIKQKEGDRLLKYIKDSAYVIALAIEGKQLDSVEFAEKLDSIGINGEGDIVFVIGGSLGLDERILRRADYKLSFSKMTFPHRLMRLVLLEQIYRAFRIIKREPYHK